MPSPAGIVPRLLDRGAAAEYCGLAPATFSDWVRRGRLPGPVPGTKRWDRRAIDTQLDRISGLVGGNDAAFEDFWAKKEQRRASA